MKKPREFDLQVTGWNEAEASIEGVSLRDQHVRWSHICDHKSAAGEYGSELIIISGGKEALISQRVEWHSKNGWSGDITDPVFFQKAQRVANDVRGWRKENRTLQEAIEATLEGDEPTEEEMDAVNISDHAPCWNSDGITTWFGAGIVSLVILELLENSEEVIIRVRKGLPEMKENNLKVANEVQAMRIVNAWWPSCLYELLKERLRAKW